MFVPTLSDKILFNYTSIAIYCRPGLSG